MVLLVLALLFVARAADDGSMPWLLAAAVALGLAFNVKLLESLVALPGIALFAYVGLPGRPARRLLKIGLAGLVYVAVSLSWLTATLLVPAGERPFAIGSSNGSAWNAAFVFNGTERLGGKSPEPQFTVYEAGHKYPVATQEERDHIPITPPSATRLLTRIGPLSGERLGMEVLVALLLGIPALLWGVLRPDDLDEVLDAEARALRSRRASGAQAPSPAGGCRRRRCVGGAGASGGRRGRAAGERSGRRSAHRVPYRRRAAGAWGAGAAAAWPLLLPSGSRSHAGGKRRRRPRASGAQAARGGPPRARDAPAPGDRGRHRPVDAERADPVQRHGAPSPALRRGLHARGRGDVRHRCRLGGFAQGPLASGVPRGDARGVRVLRRAPALRAPGRMVAGAGRGDRGDRARAAREELARGCAREVAAGARRRARADVRGGADDPLRHRHALDRNARHRRRLRRRAARRRAAPGELLPARAPGQRLLRDRVAVGDADRLADRAGRPPDPRADDVWRARVHPGRAPEAADRPGQGALRVPQLQLQPPRRAAEPGMLGTGASGCANTAPTSRAKRACGKPRSCGCCRGRSSDARHRAAADRRARRRRARGRPARARHGVHGRGPLPHAAVPDPARDPRGARRGRADRARGCAGGEPRRLRARVGARGPGGRRWSCTPGARTSRSCAGASTPRCETSSTRRSLPASRDSARRAPTSRCSPRSSACAWRRRRASPAGTRGPSPPSSSRTPARTSCTCSTSRPSSSGDCPRAGALQWAREECEPLAASSDERDPRAIFARLPRIASLNASARAVALELVEWREAHGRAAEPAGAERARRRGADGARQAQTLLARRAHADPRDRRGGAGTPGRAAARGRRARARAPARAARPSARA